MKYKVSDLEGALLDAAVARAERRSLQFAQNVVTQASKPAREYRPSRDYKQGGLIMDREHIDTIWQGCNAAEPWRAMAQRGKPCNGLTRLAAAMRAYVASNFGAEVELP